MTSPRTGPERRADTAAKLAEHEIDVWVASAGDGPGSAHLVPLSLAWIDDRAVLALEATSLTARNVIATGRARLGVGPTRDVVLIDATLDRLVELDDASNDLSSRYAAQAGWAPSAGRGAYVYLVLKPDRIQAWREANELAGRTLMRDGAWLV